MSALQRKAAKEDDAAWKSRKKKPFSTAVILEAVLGKDEPTLGRTKRGSVMGKMPSFFHEEEVREWKAWAKSTADHIGQVPKDQRKTSCRMPMKCVTADAPIKDSPACEQIQLLSYTNNNGGDSVSKE